MKAIKIKQTKDQIADLIRTDILLGALKGGEELTQEQVAEKTGLSRMPVREAFQALEQDGFLQRLPNRHMRVIAMTDRNIKQYFVTLTALEASFYQQLITENLPVEAISDALMNAIHTQKPDNELQIHLALSGSLDNVYLSSIHKKMLGSFYLHALHHCWNPACTVEHLIALQKGVQNSDTTAFEKSLNAYFSYYKNAMLKRRPL